MQGCCITVTVRNNTNPPQAKHKMLHYLSDNFANRIIYNRAVLLMVVNSNKPDFKLKCHTELKTFEHLARKLLAT